jgi:hypothetical protein
MTDAVWVSTETQPPWQRQLLEEPRVLQIGKLPIWEHMTSTEKEVFQSLALHTTLRNEGLEGATGRLGAGGGGQAKEGHKLAMPPTC